MKKLHQLILFTIHCSLFTLLVSCEKVSPIGVLVSGTGVEDRVKMSYTYFLEYKGDFRILDAPDADEYTFLVGADSHVTDDDSRMAEMLQNGLDHDDVLYAHLGDIADTKAEYYINLEDIIEEYKVKYAQKNYIEVNYLDSLKKYDPEEYEETSIDDFVNGDYMYYLDPEDETAYTLDKIQYPFFPVVGNHDITHNGWALWSNIFHSSFYDVYVYVGDSEGDKVFDHFIFLDTASGTLGKEQVNLIEQGLLDDKYAAENDGLRTRNTFVFSHTNIFRPSSLQFASTFAREESFFLLNKFVEWEADIVFCGHVHKWDEQEVGGVNYITLDSMSENNNPEPGDYLLRVHVKRNGDITWERVHMNTRKK
jgi:predicted phosphodiesterase